MSDKKDRFQALLTTGLAMGLGATLMTLVSSNDATAYPNGAVSYGANPVVSTGGTASATQTVFSAPSAHEIVVTDVVLTGKGGSQISNYYYPCHSVLTLVAGSGATVASFRLSTDSYRRYYNESGTTGQSMTVSHTFASGLPLPAGDTLDLTHTGDCEVEYTLSGYYAEP